jgi:electron transport complex protein RnfE
MFLAAEFPEISKALGPYVPLIVVNCIILCRAEAFFSKNSLLNSLSDALGMGAGFTLALVLLGGIREVLGSGTIFNFPLLLPHFRPWAIMLLPPGAFLTLGILLGVINLLGKRK